MNEDTLLQVSDLKIQFSLDEGILKAVDGIDLEIKKSSIVGLIGESGCGKSVTARAIMRILEDPGKITDGTIAINKENGIEEITAYKRNSKEMRSIRGRDISMIFQEPMTSLSPVHTVGQQITEAIYIHRTQDKKEAYEIVIDMLEKVGISNPVQRYSDYPHQLSGGMRQRVMIALALSCKPSLLIADEPTTALDVTIQAQILELMSDLQKKLNMSILYITHNLGVIAEMADETYVMYLGKIVEHGSVRQVFTNPLHPYTKRLIKSIPRFQAGDSEELDSIKGNVPIPINMPSQCGFCSRCEEVLSDKCKNSVPQLIENEPGHFVSCFKLSETEEENL